MGTPLEELIVRLSAADGKTATEEKPQRTASFNPRPEDKGIKLDKWAGLISNVCRGLEAAVGAEISNVAQKIYPDAESQEDFDTKLSEHWETLFSNALNTVLQSPETYNS